MILCYKGCKYERKIFTKNIEIKSSQNIRTVKYRGITYRLYQVPTLPSKLKYQVRYRGTYLRSESIDLSQELTSGVIQIYSILERMQSNGITCELAQAEVVKMIIDQAQYNPNKKKELMTWGRELSDASIDNTIKSIINHAIIKII